MTDEARMAGGRRGWISPPAYARLQRELVTLRRLCADAGAEEAGAEATSEALRRGWQTRIRQIHDLLVDANRETPPDDGIAEPGMVLTVRYDDTGDVETFLLGARGAEDAEIDVYSTRSPLGAAIAGASPGSRCTYRLPDGTALTVTLLDATPYRGHRAGVR